MKKVREMRNNRLVQHLGKCCLTYGCPAAVNYFMGRYEAPLPSSPACNARCIGCISLQESGCCPSTQERIGFAPTAAEIAEVAAGHLERTGHVASFGQGCEGEPLLAVDVIEEAIRRTRKATARGTINLNSNAGRPRAVARLAAAGLDSIRVSMNSARPGCHQRYYRPRDFSLEEVKESIRVMKGDGKFVSLNYFVLPGFTDTEAEYEALAGLLAECRPDFIQLRNLNMDPDWYLDEVAPEGPGRAIGIRKWLARLRKEFPGLGFGYFNPPLDQETGDRRRETGP
jgi:wyosine [tRNA(Phe)-imidazoG37] synthetase (radical SAM superfamily)